MLYFGGLHKRKLLKLLEGLYVNPVWEDHSNGRLPTETDSINFFMHLVGLYLNRAVEITGDGRYHRIVSVTKNVD